MEKIKIYRTHPNKPKFRIEPLKMPRDWMGNTRKKFLYKCLPLKIANQYGWAVLSPTNFSIMYYGGDTPPDIDIDVDNPEFDENILSYLGEGVFTIHLDFVIKTPVGYSTYIRSVPNEIKYGVRGLDAIVETDWLPFTFTYNFRTIESGTYTFKKDEPLFVFFPIERNTVENFSIEEDFIENDKEFFEDFTEYANSRIAFQDPKNRNGKNYQNFYANESGPTKKYKVLNHIKRITFGSRSDTI